MLQPSLPPPARLGAARPAGARPTANRAGTRAAVLAAVLGIHGLVMALLLAKPALETPAIAPPMMVSLMAPPQPEPAPLPLPRPPAPAPAKAVSKPAPAPRAPARPAQPQPQPQPATEASITTAVASSPAPPAPAAAPAAVEAAPAPPAPPAPPTPARFDAAYLNNPKPPYPPLAKRLRETGTVQLRVLVSAEGLAERIELVASSGSLRLDEGAQAAVRRWRFIPARQGDQNIASTVVVPIIFKLEES